MDTASNSRPILAPFGRRRIGYCTWLTTCIRAVHIMRMDGVREAQHDPVCLVKQLTGCRKSFARRPALLSVVACLCSRSPSSSLSRRLLQPLNVRQCRQAKSNAHTIRDRSFFYGIELRTSLVTRLLPRMWPFSNRNRNRKLYKSRFYNYDYVCCLDLANASLCS